jgi:anhydro-N-acetylmuramic acid kinase
LPEHYIGLMSGTSLDGVDGVLVRFDATSVQALAHVSQNFPDDFRQQLLALNSPHHNELHTAQVASNRLAHHYAQAVQTLKQQAPSLGVASITAVGAHGQTVRHQPSGLADERYTVQLLNAALLAELCALDVVADFRSRDVAAGGQGAPLVPAFHQAVFAQTQGHTCVLNLGGIANLTVLPATAGDLLLGFDCGPGNALMDGWCQQHTGQAFDAAGAWAAGAEVEPGLLQAMLAEPYFALPLPKSTGRDLFNQAWLDRHLAAFPGLDPQNVQATLAALTAHSCADSVRQVAPTCSTLIVCGGGAFNTHVMQLLQTLLPQVQVSRSDAHGLPAQQVEAAAFAWLARQTMRRAPGNVASVTGAKGPRILGAIYPA